MVRWFGLITALFLAGACSSSSVSSQDVLDSVSQEILDTAVAEATLDTQPDELPPADIGTTEVPLPDPVFQGAFVSDEVNPDEPGFSLEAQPLGDSMLEVALMAANLGTVSGVATSLSYDPEYLQWVDASPELSLGSSSEYETHRFAGPVDAGLISFGAARFCLEKSIWDDSDCGGTAITDATPLATLRFRILKAGETSLRIPDHASLVRMPDYTLVPTLTAGGQLVLTEVLP